MKITLDAIINICDTLSIKTNKTKATTMTTKVYNMCSTRSGNEIANQFILEDKNSETFQSYRTTIAIRKQGKIILDTSALDYSRTTSKYLYQFLNMNHKEIEAGVKDKSIKLRNLNK